MGEHNVVNLSRPNFMGKRQLLLFLIIFALIFSRYCYYGFHYFHQLDDYIQYHNYSPPGSTTPFKTIINLGLLAARPLAGMVDVLVWARFFNVMLVAVFAISVMFAASACIFRWVWARHFGTGYIFLIIYTLLPLGIEGTYWVSASSRIVVGLFFASVSLYFFERWCADGRRRALVFYILTQAVAYGFYEQTIAFSLTATLIVAALHFKQNRARSIWGLFSFVNLAAYVIFTGLTTESIVYGTRLGMIRAFGADYWQNTFPAVWGQVRDAFLKGGFYTLAKGAWRGVQILFADMNIIYMLVIFTLCAALYWVAYKKADSRVKNPMATLVTGLLLAVAPSALFFILPNAWFSLRSTVTSLPGLALIADTLVSLVSLKVRHSRTVTAALVSGLALLFCIASVSEMHDYRATTLKDQEIVTLLAEQLRSDDRLNPELKIAVLNVEPSYLPNQNFYHHEHIHGVTESGWALTGALESKVGLTRPDLTPMPGEVLYRPWNADSSRLHNFDCIYIYLDDEFIEITAVESGGGGFKLYDKRGSYLGHVWEEDNHGYICLL